MRPSGQLYKIMQKLSIYKSVNIKTSFDGVWYGEHYSIFGNTPLSMTVDIGTWGSISLMFD